MSKLGIVIVAGGSGTRMKNSLPKQFIPISGKPILQHTIDRFFDWDSTIQLVLVLPEDQIDFWKRLKPESGLSYKTVKGGKERFHSVKNGLEALEDVDLVLIHDGVRPIFSNEMLDRCINGLDIHDAVIPVVSPKESLRLIKGTESEHLDRSRIRLVQTPQCFKRNSIMAAFEQTFESSFTDDASVFEKSGGKVFLVEGEYTNIKVTTAEDLELLRVYLDKKA